MSDNMKNIKELGSFFDGLIGSAMSGLGCLTALLFIFLPIFVTIVFVTFMVCEGGSTHQACEPIMGITKE